jgi:F0F1-type ATP synthase assembly protein I
MPSEQEEIQKTLADLQKRAEEFQTGVNYSESSSGSSFFSSSKLKLILTLIGTILVIAGSLYFLLRSTGNKIDTKENYRPAMLTSHLNFL